MSNVAPICEMVLQISTSAGILEFNVLLLKLVVENGLIFILFQMFIVSFKFQGFASWIRCARKCVFRFGISGIWISYLPAYTVENRQFSTRFETLGEGRFGVWSVVTKYLGGVAANLPKPTLFWRRSINFSSWTKQAAEIQSKQSPNSNYKAAEPANDSVMGTIRPKSCPTLGDSGLLPIPLYPYQFDSAQSDTFYKATPFSTKKRHTI